jgi:hypothetical protein
MHTIPEAKKTEGTSLKKQESVTLDRIRKVNAVNEEKDTIIFSFDALEKNEYFNLDCTCPNWSNDLFDMMKKVSGISIGAIRAGKYAGAPLRIHPHKKANPPCDLPQKVQDKSEFYQIRIAGSKGGIHGIFSGNVFYVMWLDPLHNMYPDENFGGLRRIKPPTTCCCMDSKAIIAAQAEAIQELQQQNELLTSDVNELLAK